MNDFIAWMSFLIQLIALIWPSSPKPERERGVRVRWRRTRLWSFQRDVVEIEKYDIDRR